MCFERLQGSVVASERTRSQGLGMKLTRNWPGFSLPSMEMVRRERLGVTFR
jgi:hypothetical protein